MTQEFSSKHDLPIQGIPPPKLPSFSWAILWTG